MEELNKISVESINRYFKTLSVLGYKEYNEVNKLIVLLFIKELLEYYSDFVGEEDYKLINESLNCIYGSTCLIDIPSYSVYDDLYHKTVRQQLNARITEDDILRYSQDDILRVKA